jgi:hypothetical protein
VGDAEKCWHGPPLGNVEIAAMRRSPLGVINRKLRVSISRPLFLTKADAWRLGRRTVDPGYARRRLRALKLARRASSRTSSRSLNFALDLASAARVGHPGPRQGRREGRRIIIMSASGNCSVAAAFYLHTVTFMPPLTLAPLLRAFSLVTMPLTLRVPKVIHSPAKS